MSEAIADYSRPSQLRFLFAHLLLEHPFSATDLWARFEQELCGDYRMSCSSTKATHLALADVGRYLMAEGSSLIRCGLQQPPQLQHHGEIDQELEYFRPYLSILQRRAGEAYTNLNSEQRDMFDCIVEHNSVHQNCFFVDGRAGRRETYLMAAICSRIRGNNGIVCVTGTTALSVLDYDRGRTAHSTFGIPVQDNDLDLVSKISFHSSRAELVREAELLIWEELPMVKKAAIECVDELLQHIMQNDLPFGGKKSSL